MNTTIDKTPTRLSSSVIWDIQLSFYESLGVQAWEKGIVPSFITSNAKIASSYAHLIHSFLQDCALITPQKKRRRCYIVELGCGSGKLGYLLMKQLVSLVINMNIEIIYIFSDFHWGTLNELRNQPEINLLIQEYSIGFACIDCTDITKGIEIIMQTKEGNGEIRNLSKDDNTEIIIIGNYLLDSIPQDSFYMKNGQLYHVLFQGKSCQIEEDLTDPGILERLILSDCWSMQEVKADIYDDNDHEDCRRLVERCISYAKIHYTEEKLFMIPVAGIKLFNYFLQLQQCRKENNAMMLIIGDKSCIPEDKYPCMAIHGSFSFPVDFFILEAYCELKSGVSLVEKGHLFNIGSYVFMPNKDNTLHWNSCFNECIHENSPIQFFIDFSKAYEDRSMLSLYDIMNIIKQSEYDCDSMYKFSPQILESKNNKSNDYDAEGNESKLNKELIFQLKNMLKKVEKNIFSSFYIDYYCIIGQIYLYLSYHNDSIRCLELSIHHHGKHHVTLYHMGLAYYYSNDIQNAKKCFEESIDLCDEFGPVWDMLELIDINI